jgi:hypothetical protein
MSKKPLVALVDPLDVVELVELVDLLADVEETLAPVHNPPP